MDERLRVISLLDAYGTLLGDKARTILNDYYNEDLSLSEIAELQAASRQAVHGQIKRAVAQLYAFEDALGLLQRRESVLEIIQILQSPHLSDEERLACCAALRKEIDYGI